MVKARGSCEDAIEAMYKALRPDVQVRLRQLGLAPHDPIMREELDEQYKDAKDEISHVCGWDANRDDYDQRMYDNAIAYVVAKFHY